MARWKLFCKKYELGFYGPLYLFLLLLILAGIWATFSPTAKEIVKRNTETATAKIEAEYGKFAPIPYGQSYCDEELFQVKRLGQKQFGLQLVVVQVLRKDTCPTFTAFIDPQASAKPTEIWRGKWVWIRLNPGVYSTIIVLTEKRK